VRNARGATKKKGASGDDAMLIFALPVLLAAVLGTALRARISYAAKCGVVPRRAAVGLARRTVAASRRTGRRRLLFIDRTHAGCRAVVQVAHRDERAGQQLPLAEIRVLEDYLAPVSPRSAAARSRGPVTISSTGTSSTK